MSRLHALQAGGKKRPLFLVHPILGAVRGYHALAGALDAERPLYALEAAGFDGAPPRSTVEEMAFAYCEAIRAVQPAGPYLLGGWSIGGVIAFEMAQQIIQSGEAVAWLGILDARAPGPELHRRSVDFDDETIVKMYAQHLARVDGEAPPPLPERRDRAALHAFALARAIAHGALPVGAGEAEVAAHLAVFAKNLGALFRYHPAPYPQRIALFQTREELPDHPRPPTLGWEEHAGDRIDHRSVDGNHFTLASPRHAAALAKELRLSLPEER